MSKHNICFNCCKTNICNDNSQTKEYNRRNKIIKKKNDKHFKCLTQKILLLGTGESGKSTFLRQMRIITGKSFSEIEIMTFKSVIYDNIYKGVLFLLQARSTLNIPWESGGTASAAEEQLEEHFHRTRAQRRERTLRCGVVAAWSEEEFLHLVPLYHVIWADTSIRKAFDQRNRLITEDFSENTRYYLNRLHQIATPNYIPTNEDIVWSRRPTDSIIEEEILVHGTPLIFIDVGGQTKERRKWCQNFADMTSVLFLVGSSHYDELYFDRVTSEYRNKLREAMTVFEGLINLYSFRRASIIIFFNKSDLLKEKIMARVSGIRAHFSEFPLDANEFDLTAVQDFLVESFSSLVDHVVFPSVTDLAPTSSSMFDSPFGRFRRRSTQTQIEIDLNSPLNVVPSRRSIFSSRLPRKRTIYRHFTTAVDKKNIQMVCNAMQDTILQNNLRRLMMS